jgi:hypothetical protein
MNERIRELAGQAGFETEHHKWIFANDNVGEGECHELLEKFAELIVRECAGIVDNKIEVSRYVHEAELLRECSTTIKLHFGVKE